jgi:deazaflavin-dependent oxidoreductase (nitroreductase family)
VTAGEAEFLYLTTTGRRTGQPREIEIWFTRHAGRYYLVAEHRDKANWVQNLRANPQVHVRVADATFEATARVVEASAEPVLSGQIQALSEKKYGWGEGLIVELTPPNEITPTDTESPDDAPPADRAGGREGSGCEAAPAAARGA